MAPLAPPNGRHCTICNKDINCIHRSTKNSLDADTIALELARNEVLLASQALEQLLDVMRRANSQQLQSLFAAARSGLPQDQFLAMVEQFDQDLKKAEPK